MAIVGGNFASSELGPGLRPTHPYYKMNSQPEYVLVKSSYYLFGVLVYMDYTWPQRRHHVNKFWGRVDADWAVDLDIRSSHTWYILIINGGPILKLDKFLTR